MFRYIRVLFDTIVGMTTCCYLATLLLFALIGFGSGHYEDFANLVYFLAPPFMVINTINYLLKRKAKQRLKRNINNYIIRSSSKNIFEILSNNYSQGIIIDDDNHKIVHVKDKLNYYEVFSLNEITSWDASNGVLTMTTTRTQYLRISSGYFDKKQKGNIDAIMRAILA
ncbi:hypothetical protein ABLA30_03895 [Xenorhabdus nematophila]|uniref:hypothetical protein n=1 Tax=Xenorhabdus nematophila TaxID=628 RepID=UPI0032B8652B